MRDGDEGGYVEEEVRKRRGMQEGCRRGRGADDGWRRWIIVEEG